MVRAMTSCRRSAEAEFVSRRKGIDVLDGQQCKMGPGPRGSGTKTASVEEVDSLGIRNRCLVDTKRKPHRFAPFTLRRRTHHRAATAARSAAF